MARNTYLLVFERTRIWLAAPQSAAHKYLLLQLHRDLMPTSGLYGNKTHTHTQRGGESEREVREKERKRERREEREGERGRKMGEREVA